MQQSLTCKSDALQNAEPNCQNGRAELAAMRREIRFLKKQDHSCIVNLLAEVVPSQGEKSCGFLMTVAKGGTLKDLQRQLRYVPWHESALLCIMTCTHQVCQDCSGKHAFQTHMQLQKV